MNDHYIYRAFDRAGRLLYIGCTKNPAQRQATHRRSSPWAKFAVRFDLEGPYGRNDAYARERHAIDAERTFFNSTAEDTAAVQANRREARRLLAGQGIPAAAYFDDFAPVAAQDDAANEYVAALNRVRRSLTEFPYLTAGDRMRRYLAAERMRETKVAA